MLAIFLLAGIVGLGLLAYFWPPASGDSAFPVTRAVFGAGILAYALSYGFAKLMVIDGDDDYFPLVAIAEGISWLLLLLGWKGIFVLLAKRGVQVRRNPQ